MLYDICRNGGSIIMFKAIKERKKEGDSTLKTKPIDVGVVGVGSLGQHHARLYSNNSAANLTCIYDPDYIQRKKIANKYNTVGTNGLEALLDQVEAVSIVSPTETHFDIAKKALKKEVHCLVEKPMVDSLGKAKKLYTMAQSKNALLQVGHIERFNPAYKKAVSHINAPETIQAKRFSGFKERVSDTSVVLDLMIHDIDLALALIDEPVVSVKSSTESCVTSRADKADATIYFKNGATARLSTSRVSNQPQRTMQVNTNDNEVKIDYDNSTVAVYSDKHNERPYQLPVPENEPLAAELNHFINAILSNETPDVSEVEGRKAIEIAFKIMST